MISLKEISNGWHREERIVHSPYTGVHLPESTISDFILSHAAKFGNKKALIEAETGRYYTYREVVSFSRRVAGWLTNKGVKPGYVVSFYLSNTLEYAIAFVGVTLVGGIVAVADPASPAPDLDKQLQENKARYLFCDENNVQVALQVIENLPGFLDVIIIGDAKGCVPFSNLLEYPELEAGRAPHLDPGADVCVMFRSSGTTGKPKCVMLTHRNIVSNICQYSHVLLTPYQTDDVQIGVVPMFHCYGIQLFIVTLVRGITEVQLKRFKPELFLQAIESYEVTILPIVAPLVLFLLQSPLVSKYNLSSIKHVQFGATSLTTESAEALVKKFNLVSFRQSYGMTELGPIATSYSPFFEPNYKSIGPPLPNTEAKVVDIHDGRALDSGEIGEMCFRGPQVMKGYLNNHEATSKIIDSEGWLHTGDVGFYDEDSNFYIIDRIKDIIRYKGHQVPPAELEGVLVQHPAVLDAAVIGVPEEPVGELARAYVCLKEDCVDKVTVEDIHKFVNERVSPIKKLRGGIIFVDSIPRSASGKILRRKFKENNII